MAPRFSKGTKNTRRPAPLLSFLPSTGAGMPAVPAVVCLQSVFPQIFTGQWICFHGDGTAHGPGGSVVASGSPSTQTLPSYNGLNCASVTRQRTTTGSAFFTGPTYPLPATSMTLGAVFVQDAGRWSGGTIVGQWGSNSVTDSAFYIGINSNNSFGGVYKDHAGTNFGLGGGTWIGGCEHIYIAAVTHLGADNNTLNSFVDGVATVTKTGLLDVNSQNIQPFKIAPGLSGAIRCAFYTETALQQSDVTAIQSYLYPMPQGTRGELASFTRNSLASMIASDGTLIWLPPGRPAINGGVKCRNVITNLLLWSEDFTNAAWTKSGTITATSNTGLAPDGSLTADTLTSTVLNSTMIQSTISNGGDYTGSIWVRTTSGTQTVSLLLWDNTASVARGPSTNFTATTTWQRFSLRCSSSFAPSGNTLRFQFYPSGNQTGQLGSVQVYGAQFEAGSLASDYVRSEGTQGTAAAEICTVPMPGVRQNLIAFSQDLTQANWANLSGVTVTADQDIAPDGTKTADQATATSTTSHFDQRFTTNGNGGPYTFSIWARIASGSPTIKLAFFDATSSSTLIQTPFTPTSTWARYSVTVPTTTAGHLLDVILFPDNAGTGTGSMYFWGAQVEVGSNATDYIPTTNAGTGTVTALNPTVDYRNLALWSESFDQSLWSKSLSSVTINATTAPDGSSNADKLLDSTSNGQHVVSQNITLVAGNNYVASVYAKAAEWTKLLVQIKQNDGTFKGGTFDLSAGTIISGAGGTASITNVGNGWYRCSYGISNVPSGASQALLRLMILDASASQNFVGTGTQGLYLWGAQLEIGTTVATDYRQTTSVIGNFQPREGSTSISIAPAWGGTNPFGTNLFFIDMNSGHTGRLPYMPPSSASVFAFNGTTNPGVAAAFAAGVKSSFLSRWSRALNSTEIDNLTSGVSGTPAQFYGFGTTFDPTIAIGFQANSTAGQPSAVISDIILHTDPNGWSPNQ